jgi:hypothetical protein
MGEGRASEIVSLVLSLVTAVDDGKMPKYKSKLLNCFINNSLRYIKNEINPPQKKFSVLVSLLSLCRLSSLVEEGSKVGESIDSAELGEVLAEISEFLAKKKALMIRAVILDLVETHYTEDREYSTKEEKWILQVESEIKGSLDLSALKRGSRRIRKIEEIGGGLELSGRYGSLDREAVQDVVSESTQYALALLANMVLKEVRDIFLSKNNKLGRSANQLIVNVLHLEKSLSQYVDYGEETKKMLGEIEGRFRERKDCEAEYLRKLVAK